jgi:quercetin dioxygenase-like cupin family protein
MVSVSAKSGLAVALCAALVLSPASFLQAQTGVERKVLLQQDLNIPGYETVLAAVGIAVGGREGKHTHAGTALVYVEEGELTLEQQGLPTRTYKAGDSFLVKPGQVHEGINGGKTPVKAVATFIVEKGKPLTTQVK